MSRPSAPSELAPSSSDLAADVVRSIRELAVSPPDRERQSVIEKMQARLKAVDEAVGAAEARIVSLTESLALVDKMELVP